MPTISGPLSVVTGDAAVVTAVWVQVRELRTHGDGAILPQRARVTIGEDITINFECVDGPAVLIWQAGGVEDQVPILVSEEPSQTLSSVVRAAQLASGRTQDELAALVAQVVRDASSASAAAGSASSSAESAASARDTAVAARNAAVDARDEAVSAANSATGAASTSASARDAAVLARNEAEGYSAAASTSATHAADDAASAQLAESGAGTARDQAQTLVSQANQALDQALAVIADAESLQDVVTALEMVDTKISAAIADLVGTAPEHLDTLGELAAAVEGMGTGDVLWSELTPVLDGKAAVSHQHSVEDVTGLEDLLWDLGAAWGALLEGVETRINTAEARIDTRKGVIHSGTGNPPSSIPGAVVGDYWLNEADMSLHKITSL